MWIVAGTNTGVFHAATPVVAGEEPEQSLCGMWKKDVNKGVFTYGSSERVTCQRCRSTDHFMSMLEREAKVPQPHQLENEISFGIEDIPEVDLISNPSHYFSGTPYEVHRVLEVWGLLNKHYLATTIEYIARAGNKNSEEEIKDLKKARYNLNKHIMRLENGTNEFGVTLGEY